MHANSQNQPLPRQRIRNYWLLLRGDRPIGVLLLLWPTWWALWLAAQGTPPLHLLAIFTAGVWLTRSAGCVITDYADRWLDGQVKRTRDRPLATGAGFGREALLGLGKTEERGGGKEWVVLRRLRGG